MPMITSQVSMPISDRYRLLVGISADRSDDGLISVPYKHERHTCILKLIFMFKMPTKILLVSACWSLKSVCN